MTIAIAQTRPITGDIRANITQHQKLIEHAVHDGADTIIFPELSIIGYEPTLARQLATTPDDHRFAVFQAISNEKAITIGIGLPIKTATDPVIGLLLFQPYQHRQVYSKQYLHPDEESFFIPGQKEPVLLGESKVSFAICYEISVPEHSVNAHRSGAEYYIASVAKSVQGINKAKEQLSKIAEQYALHVLMANCIGINDTMLCAGQSSAWNDKGQLLGQLDDRREGILLVDTKTGEAVEQYI